MSTKLLQKIKCSLSPALSLIINQSLFTGIFSDSLKRAKILPIFETRDPSYFGNYRPISPLSAISKVFQKVVFIQIYEYFNCCIKVSMGFVLTIPLSLPVLNLLTKYCSI